MIHRNSIKKGSLFISCAIAGVCGLILAYSFFFHPIFPFILLIGCVFVFWAFYDIKSFIFVLLAFKPLVDLTWNLVEIEIMGSKMSIQGGLAIGTLILLGTYVAFIERPRLTPPLGWLLAFAGVNCLSFLFGTKNGTAIADFLRVISAVPFLVLGRHVFGNRQTILRFGFIFLIVLLVPYVIAFLQEAGYVEWGYHTIIEGEQRFRVTGGYMHPFDLYKYVFLAVPLIFLISIESKSLKTKFFAGLSLCFAGIATSLTLLRMAILAFIFQNSLWFWLRKKFVIATTCITIAIVLSLTISSVGALFKEHIDVFLKAGEREKVLNWRGAIWKGQLDFYRSGSIFQQVIGYGLYTDARQFERKYYPGGTRPNDSHNDYIRILVENGLLGIVCYIGFILTLFYSIPKNLETPFSRNYGIVAKIVLITFLVMSITGRPTEEVTCFWYLLAIFSPFAMRSFPQ